MVIAWATFLSFLSLRGLLQQMVIAWIISGLSVTMKSFRVDGDGMDHFLIFSITTSSATADDDSMDLFQVFSVTLRSARVDGDSMDHFLVFYVTLRSAATDGDSMTILWSFLSP